MEFSRLEYGSGLPFPPPEDLPDPGMRSASLVPPALAGGFFGASLVAQMAKSLPAMWETQVRSLGLEDPLEKGMATHSSILAWRNPMNTGQH